MIVDIRKRTGESFVLLTSPAVSQANIWGLEVFSLAVLEKSTLVPAEVQQSFLGDKPDLRQL